MKKFDNKWVDGNNNSWDAKEFSKKEAESFSRLLENCHNCFNCFNCKDCYNCSSCYNCDDCHYCSNCDDCYGCYGCSDCSNCDNCSDCHNCSDCSDCHDCSNCNNCYDCSGFDDNPQRIISKRMGSRNDQTTIYFNNEKTLVICGCFFGTIEQFKEAVLKKYNQDHEYMKWIKAAELYIEGVK